MADMSAVAALASSSFSVFCTTSNASILSPACRHSRGHGGHAAGSTFHHSRGSTAQSRRSVKHSAAEHSEPDPLPATTQPPSHRRAGQPGPTSQSLNPSTASPHSVPADTSRTSSFTRRRENSLPCSGGGEAKGWALEQGGQDGEGRREKARPSASRDWQRRTQKLAPRAAQPAAAAQAALAGPPGDPPSGRGSRAPLPPPSCRA